MICLLLYFVFTYLHSFSISFDWFFVPKFSYDWLFLRLRLVLLLFHVAVASVIRDTRNMMYSVRETHCFAFT